MARIRRIGDMWWKESKRKDSRFRNMALLGMIADIGILDLDNIQVVKECSYSEDVGDFDRDGF